MTRFHRPDSVAIALATFFSLLFIPGVLFSQDKKPRVLLLTESKGFVHAPVKRLEGELAPCEVAMRQLSLESNAFTIELSQDSASAITRENLERLDVVMFYTSGNLPISDVNMEYFINAWLKQSKHGFIGIHSATDTLKNEPRYLAVSGGAFNGHPWTQNTTVAIKVSNRHIRLSPPFLKKLFFKRKSINTRVGFLRMFAS